MDVPPSAYPAIGAVTAAIIAGGISFVVTVLAKEQKTSEFRQAWIDALRNDVSDFISTVGTLSSFLRLKRGQPPADLLAFLEQRSDDVHRMGVSYNRILLRLNPREHTKLTTRLKDLLSVMSSYEKALDEKHVDQLTDEVVAEAQRILKAEWRRVKRGEIVFRATKYISLALVILAVAFAVAVAGGYLVITWRV